MRTWTESEGERFYEMSQERACQDDEGGEAIRFQALITPDQEGVIWYRFDIDTRDGAKRFYGAKPGYRGGVGSLCDWEPPSFKLSVHAEKPMPPAWYEPIGDFLFDETAHRELPEIVRTLCENFPVRQYRQFFPWHVDELDAFACPGDVEPLDRCPSFDGGASPVFALADDVVGFWRKGDAETAVCVVLNTSTETAHDVHVPMADEAVSELIGGYEVETTPADPQKGNEADSRMSAVVDLAPLGVACLLFHRRERIQREMDPGMGVLAHITSLPADGAASLGAPARAFVDRLAAAGAKYWQVLPVSPTDEYGSPYAGISAFAGNALLLEGGLESRMREEDANLEGFREFCDREASWLEPYSAFMAIRDVMGPNIAWQQWPEPYGRYDADVIEDDGLLAAHAKRWKLLQYEFERQWMDLRAYANERGVAIIGDMPLYVSADSADAWAHPQLFQLDDEGQPLVVAGCPPDAFAANGQVWGNPIYDWETMQGDGFEWWMQRLRRAFSLYDVVRLDHFIGFSRYYSIPLGKNASEGSFRPGPGYRFFHQAFDRFGPLPLIAEDLGLITPRVRCLSAVCGFPGMDIVQFADGDPLQRYTPRPGKVVYTGTHDNQTLVAFCKDRYPGLDACETARKITRAVVECGAEVCVIPLQDLLELDDEARMNVPGVAEGNWSWQAPSTHLDAAFAKLGQLVLEHQQAVCQAKSA